MADKQNKESFMERAAHLLDIPAEAMAGVSYVEIIGAHEMLVENHRGIIEYTETEIKINTDGKILRVFGTDLFVEAMNANQLKLFGKIETVQFVAV